MSATYRLRVLYTAHKCFLPLYVLKSQYRFVYAFLSAILQRRVLDSVHSWSDSKKDTMQLKNTRLVCETLSDFSAALELRIFEARRPIVTLSKRNTIIDILAYMLMQRFLITALNATFWHWLCRHPSEITSRHAWAPESSFLGRFCIILQCHRHVH